MYIYIYIYIYKYVYIYIHKYILLKIKITETHSTVPYLTFSKSGTKDIKLIKRKLFKIYILGS